MHLEWDLAIVGEQKYLQHEYDLFPIMHTQIPKLGHTSEPSAHAPSTTYSKGGGERKGLEKGLSYVFDIENAQHFWHIRARLGGRGVGFVSIYIQGRNLILSHSQPPPASQTVRQAQYPAIPWNLTQTPGKVKEFSLFFTN